MTLVTIYTYTYVCLIKSQIIKLIFPHYPNMGLVFCILHNTECDGPGSFYSLQSAFLQAVCVYECLWPCASHTHTHTHTQNCCCSMYVSSGERRVQTASCPRALVVLEAASWWYKRGKWAKPLQAAGSNIKHTPHAWYLDLACIINKHTCHSPLCSIL